MTDEDKKREEKLAQQKLAFEELEVKKAEAEYKANMGFHYSRERRLSSASAGVRSINDGNITRANLFKTLFGTGSTRMLLFVILFVFASSGIATRFMAVREGEDGEFHHYQGVLLGGNELALAIYPVEQALILLIIRSAPVTGEFHVGAVDIAVTPATANDESQVFTHRIFFNVVEQESFQLLLPFEGDDFFVVLDAGQERRALRLRI